LCQIEFIRSSNNNSDSNEKQALSYKSESNNCYTEWPNEKWNSITSQDPNDSSSFYSKSLIAISIKLSKNDSDLFDADDFGQERKNIQLC
jgi:hypothetical protein